MEAFGTHVILELSQCVNIHSFDSSETLEVMMLESVQKGNLSPLLIKTHKFDPQGISSVAILQESHLSCHLFPEIGYASMDVYTCGEQNRIGAYLAASNFAFCIGAKEITILGLKRGIPFTKGYTYRIDIESHNLFYDDFLGKI